MKKTIISSILVVLISLMGLKPADACTNFLITKGASIDGSTMISYAADSHVLYGELYFRPAADYPAGTMMKIYEWDTGKYLGEIPQALHTYSVVGNMNEFQVAIGETTYGGHEELYDTTAIIDYGSLMYIALQRSKTAREAIHVMTDLVAKYGYASEGESFSISDPNEVWIMEMIGKGVGNKGAIWVARLVPDGYVCAHANQARITTFPFQKTNDWNNLEQTTYHSPDIISFAKEKGYWKGDDKNFSFSDAYAPVSFEGARFCEIRVWSFFKSVNPDMEKYFDYASGKILKDKNGVAVNRMPLWIKPAKKLSVQDVQNFMRDHLEGTPLDMRKDIGAGPFGCPYRWRPLTWKVDSVEYCNERATSTQQTGFSFVAQGRSWLPNKIGGINWFGVDDANTSVYVPIYCGVKRVPEAYKQGNGDMLTFSETSAFWMFNRVSNFAYLRYNYIEKDIKKVQKALETKFKQDVEKTDKIVGELYKTSHYKAVKYITNFSVNAGQEAFNKWKDLYHYLVVKYIDGNIKKEKDGKFLTNGSGIAVGPSQPGYSADWYKRIVNETGDKFLVLDQKNLPQKEEVVTMVSVSKTNFDIMIGAIVVLTLIVLIMLFRKRK